MKKLIVMAFAAFVWCSLGVAVVQAAEGGAGQAQGVVDEDAAQTANSLANYDAKIKQLEERVGDLKEKIFRTKTRLLLLEETMLGGVIGGAKLVVTHHNELTGLFKLASAAYYLDGNLIFRKNDTNGDLAKQEKLELFSNPITASNHLVSVYMVYQGDNSMFTYLKGLEVKLKSSYAFVAKEGKACQLDVIGYDRGGALMDMKDRPAITYKIDYSDLTERDADEIQAMEATE